jgi:hypothetical protein
MFLCSSKSFFASYNTVILSFLLYVWFLCRVLSSAWLLEGLRPAWDYVASCLQKKNFFLVWVLTSSVFSFLLRLIYLKMAATWDLRVTTRFLDSLPSWSPGPRVREARQCEQSWHTHPGGAGYGHDPAIWLLSDTPGSFYLCLWLNWFNKNWYLFCW